MVVAIAQCCNSRRYPPESKDYILSSSDTLGIAECLAHSGPSVLLPFISYNKNRAALRPTWPEHWHPIKSYLLTQMSLSKIQRGRAGSVSENASGLD